MRVGALRVDMNKVQATLDSLKEGEEVEIAFADASKNYNVKTITNTVVACHKRVPGRFLTLTNERAYGTEYLLLRSWDYNNHKPVIWSIVVSTIVYIKRISKLPQKHTSDIGQVYLGGGGLKTIPIEDGIGEAIEENER